MRDNKLREMLLYKRLYTETIYLDLNVFMSFLFNSLRLLRSCRVKLHQVAIYIFWFKQLMQTIRANIIPIFIVIL